MIYYFPLLYAKTLDGKLNPELKANLNEDLFICHWSESGSKIYNFTENDNIISVTYLFQHLPSAEILSQ